MISAVLDHLWQSTLLAAAIAALAVVFRNARASVRYGLWLAASVKFLVPFAALAVLGRLLAPAIRPPAETGVVFIARAAEPFSQPGVATPAAQTTANAAATSHVVALPDLTPVLFGIWALGVAIVLIVWMARWARIRPLVGLAAPVALAAPMPVLASPTMLEPGLVGLWRPVLIVPEALFDHLDRPGIEALVAHETCHYRRRDNLTAAVHMLVEALFWFHPMVWWIGGRLVDERERACDEAVVRSGHDPADYAASLLACCRLFLQSPLRCVAGASGSNLSRRVELIMTLPPSSSLSRAGTAGLVAAGICAVATPMIAGWLTSPTTRQSLVAGPVGVLVQAAVAATPNISATAPTNIPVQTDAVPAARVQRVAALRQVPMQLAPPPSVTLLKTLPDVGEANAARLQLALLQTPQPDNGQAAPAPSATPNTGVTHDRKGRTCWAGRPSCAPEDHAIGVGGVWIPDYASPGHGDSVGPIDPGTAAAIPQAQLTAVADARPPQATSPRAPGQLWLECKTVRVLQPSPHVTHLCLAQNDWDKTLPQASQPSGARQ